MFYIVFVEGLWHTSDHVHTRIYQPNLTMPIGYRDNGASCPSAGQLLLDRIEVLRECSSYTAVVDMCSDWIFLFLFSIL